MTWTAKEIRSAFVNFFVKRGHEHMKSSPLIPSSDPTLYFTNAGMVQFKDIFVGSRTLDTKRATTVQKCLRVSGKHNDLENVGHTARHHTFFEMLGNFSFGDYFKEDAIVMAWTLLTEVFKLPVEKLFVSVHPEDAEAYDIWRQRVGIPESRMFRDKDNFWQMGDIGPCGPCSEIYIDLGPEMSGGVVDVAFGSEEGEHRYLELWNLVFMQFDRSHGIGGGIVQNNLPRPSIDTGAGLERLVAVLQGKHNNFDTDLFVPIIEVAAKRAKVKYHENQKTDAALRVIADHSRATAFLVADGIYPDNEGRGYVLRRIMRRAIRFGVMLGIEGPFLVDTTQKVVDELKGVYPELGEAEETIQRIVLQEEKRFGHTLKSGLKLLNDESESLLEEGKRELSGRVAFTLYDTHGFPPDLTKLILEEQGLSYSEEEFHAAMEEQRERARAASHFAALDLAVYQELVEEGGLKATEFTGYESEKGQGEILAILVDGVEVPRALAGQNVELILDTTPFYANAGGQVGDQGLIRSSGAKIIVKDVQKPFGGLIVHQGLVDYGSIRKGDQVSTAVDHAARSATRKNHSATHLLHHALRTVLGEHVRQRGSLVAPDRLRFDFSHTGPMSDAEREQVEILVNQHVIENEAVKTETMSFDDAVANGAIHFFDEKYGDKVRVLSVGSESVELCGGTHVNQTGDIGLFKIVSEAPISSGVRRIEALTGMAAVRHSIAMGQQLRQVASELHVSSEDVGPRFALLLEERKQLTKELEQTRLQWREAQAFSSLSEAKEVHGAKVLGLHLKGLGGKDIRPLAESLLARLQAGVLLLVGSEDDKVSMVIASSKGLEKKFPAGQAVSKLAPLIGGKGGGRPQFAQAGGHDVSGIQSLIETFYEEAQSALQAH